MLLSINTHIHNRPEKRGGHWFAAGFESKDLSMAELADQVRAGHAFSSQFAKGRRSKANFIASGVIAADVDYGMTIEQALNHPLVRNNAGMIYTTGRHTPEHNRFRIVFELEAPIESEKTYHHALLGLISRLLSDRSCQDGARFFYGNTSADVFHIGKVLAAHELEVLVEQGRIIDERSGSKRRSKSDLKVDERPSLVFSDSFQAGMEVMHASGSLVGLEDIPEDDRSIYCPFHMDANPSAYVVTSQVGVRGIACQACGVTRWPSEAPSISFDWHKLVVDGARSDGQQTGSLRHPSGTNVDVIDARYLPDLNIGNGVTYIRSPKGTGKTEFLKREVARLRKQGARVLLVGHRKALLGNLAKRLGLPNYQDEANTGAWRDTGCLAVSVESLAKFVDTGKDRFDVLIIDESEQVTAHFKSDTLSDRRTLAYLTLEFYLRNTSCVICSDADAGEMTAGLLTITKNKDYPDRFIFNQYKVDSTAMPVYVYESEDGLYSQLLDQVSAGHRCFVATNSKATADRIHEATRRKHPDKRHLLITSDTSSRPEVVRFIGQPSQETLNYDSVIYSPSLSTGVDISFDTVGVVDTVFGFFFPHITTHFDIDQQISRVRNPRSIKVWISDARYRYQTDPFVIRDEMMANRDLASRLVRIDEAGRHVYGDDNLLTLIAWITAVQRASMSDLRSNFIALRQENGFEVHVVEPADGLTPLPSGKIDQSELVRQICSAKKITAAKYKDYVRNSKRGVAAKLDYEIKRYEIESFYGVDVDEDLVSRDLSGPLRARVSELRNMLADVESIKRLDRREMFCTHLSSVDWKQRVRRKELLSELLSSADLYEPKDGFAETAIVNKSNLGRFIATVKRHQKDVVQVFGVNVRSDLEEAPVLQLKEILKLVGMTVTKSHSTASKGQKIVHYRFDDQSYRRMKRFG